MKYLLVLLLIPNLAQALCEREETLYVNSVNLYIDTSHLYENNKRLFEAKKIAPDQMFRSYDLYQRTLNMVFKSQNLYYECKARTQV